LYVSKYKNLSIDEVRAMIDTREIFDDIGESLAVQQYGQEVAEKVQRENATRLFRLGLSAEQIAEALDLPLETVTALQQRQQ
jgi:DNA-directed RNA polymerase specialized sigma24 family protein